MIEKIDITIPELNEEWQNVQDVHPTLNQTGMISKN
jgi:hypothetical protein